MNNTSTAATEFLPNNNIDGFELGQLVLLCTMLLACLIGNLLVITAITRTRKLRTPSNYLIVHLSLCDIMVAVSAIPFTGIIFNIYYGSKVFPYGYIGCKLLWPFATYACNCSVFTLAIIAVERYVNISSIRGAKYSRKCYIFAIFGIHLLAVALAIPYSIKLKYQVSNERAQCFEAWTLWERKFYTIVLLLIQYVVPLVVMAVFYLLAWRKLYAHNISMIKMTEEYEQSMDWNVPYRKKSQISVTPSRGAVERQFSTTSEMSNSPHPQKMSNIEKKLSRRRESEYKRRISHGSRSGSLQPTASRSGSLQPASNRSGSLHATSGRSGSLQATLGTGVEGKASPTPRGSINDARRESNQKAANRRKMSAYSNKNENRRESTYKSPNGRRNSAWSSPLNGPRGSINSNQKGSSQDSTENSPRNSSYSSPQNPGTPIISRDNSITTTYKYTSKRKQSRCGGSIVSIEKESYRRKTSSISFSPLQRKASTVSNASIKDAKRFSKSRYKSQTAYTRHMQTVKTLKMFTVVVVVFACFALPNQINWLLTDFGTAPPEYLSKVFFVLTYVSSVVNCWIYGGYHKEIRKAYVNLLYCCICRRRKIRRRYNPSMSKSTTTSSLYDSMQEEIFRRRMSSFNHIFEDVHNNFDSMQHLYQSAEDLNEEEDPNEKVDGTEEEEQPIGDVGYEGERDLLDMLCELEEINEEEEEEEEEDVEKEVTETEGEEYEDGQNNDENSSSYFGDRNAKFEEISLLG